VSAVLRNRVLRIVELARDNKAIDITALDLRRVSNFCDFFVILTGTSKTHIKAIADSISGEMRSSGLRTHHAEGYQESRWVVLDYLSIIVHIFDEETRSFYDLEHLWADAAKLNLKPAKKRKAKIS
jgi:ribosome-associated protein